VAPGRQPVKMKPFAYLGEMIRANGETNSGVPCGPLRESWSLFTS